MCVFKPLTCFFGCSACKENRVNAEGIPVSEKDLAGFTTGKTKRAAILMTARKSSVMPVYSVAASA
jgi:hypothetical protein